MANFLKMTAKAISSPDKSAALLESLKQLRETQVLVGIPAEKAPRDKEEAHGQAINNAALAYIHSNGMPSQNLPARPFLEPGIKNANRPIVERFQQAGEAALDGNVNGMLKNLTAAGIIATSSVKAKIDTGPFEPLKPSTLAARRRRGRTGEKPLLDTTQMRNAVSFVLRKRR